MTRPGKYVSTRPRSWYRDHHPTSSSFRRLSHLRSLVPPEGPLPFTPRPALPRFAPLKTSVLSLQRRTLFESFPASSPNPSHRQTGQRPTVQRTLPSNHRRGPRQRPTTHPGYGQWGPLTPREGNRTKTKKKVSETHGSPTRDPKPVVHVPRTKITRETKVVVLVRQMVRTTGPCPVHEVWTVSMYKDGMKDPRGLPVGPYPPFPISWFRDTSLGLCMCEPPLFLSTRAVLPSPETFPRVYSPDSSSDLSSLLLPTPSPPSLPSPRPALKGDLRTPDSLKEGSGEG